MPAKCPPQHNRATESPHCRGQAFRPVPFSCHTCICLLVENMVKDDSSVYLTFFLHLCIPVPGWFLHHWTFKCAFIFVMRVLLFFLTYRTNARASHSSNVDAVEQSLWLKLLSSLPQQWTLFQSHLDLFLLPFWYKITISWACTTFW